MDRAGAARAQYSHDKGHHDWTKNFTRVALDHHFGAHGTSTSTVKHKLVRGMTQAWLY